MKLRLAAFWSVWVLIGLFLVAAALWAMVARAAPSPVAKCPVMPVSINCINLADVELVNVNNPWEGITDPSVRQMVVLVTKRERGMDAILCGDFAERGIQWPPCE